jgi:Tfp pilus assembly protein FimT
MKNERGMTLFEVVMVLGLASVALLATVTVAVPWIARERSRSAVYDVQSYLQLTRIEAVSRNRECRFVVDTATRILQVYDGNATASTTDDRLLYETTLPSKVQFARPDSGTAVTLSQIASSTKYQTKFSSDGIVTEGTGLVSVLGGNEYNRVQVYAAGGVTVDRWSGSTWNNEGGQTTSSTSLGGEVIDGGGDGYIYENY